MKFNLKTPVIDYEGKELIEMDMSGGEPKEIAVTFRAVINAAVTSA